MSITYEEQRTEQEKRIDADVLARVQRGLAWLEETHGPGWEDKIDMATLNLRQSDRCVLGQVYEDQRGNWRDGFTYASHTLMDSAASLGFDIWESGDEWPPLQEAWEFVLTPRVGKPPE